MTMLGAEYFSAVFLCNIVGYLGFVVGITIQLIFRITMSIIIGSVLTEQGNVSCARSFTAQV